MLLTVCATTGPGASEDIHPPRLMKDATGAMIGGRPAAFGLVPADTLAAGVAACGEEKSSSKPGGHHSRAMGDKGKPILGCGFPCAAK